MAVGLNALDQKPPHRFVESKTFYDTETKSRRVRWETPTIETWKNNVFWINQGCFKLILAHFGNLLPQFLVCIISLSYRKIIQHILQNDRAKMFHDTDNKS
jgi:hypothetical protein